MAGVIGEVDRRLMGAPEGTLGNPTFLLFCGTLGLAAASSWAWLAGWLPAPAAILLNAACLYALYTVSHEASHRLAHRTRSVNDWMGRIAAALEGASFQSYRLAHLQHHAHTNDEARDPDRVLGNRPTWALPVWVLWRIANEYTWAARLELWRDSTGLREHRLTVALQLGVVGMSAAWGRLEELLVVWIAPMLLSGLAVYVVVGWLVHVPHASRHPLENARNVGGTWARVLTLNQSLHHVHHLWMTIPWFRYPRARRIAAEAVRAHRLLPARAS